MTDPNVIADIRERRQRASESMEESKARLRALGYTLSKRGGTPKRSTRIAFKVLAFCAGGTVALLAIAAVLGSAGLVLMAVRWVGGLV